MAKDERRRSSNSMMMEAAPLRSISAKSPLPQSLHVSFCASNSASERHSRRTSRIMRAVDLSMLIDFCIKSTPQVGHPSTSLAQVAQTNPDERESAQLQNWMRYRGSSEQPHHCTVPPEKASAIIGASGSSTVSTGQLARGRHR